MSEVKQMYFTLGGQPNYLGCHTAKKMLSGCEAHLVLLEMNQILSYHQSIAINCCIKVAFRGNYLSKCTFSKLA